MAKKTDKKVKKKKEKAKKEEKEKKKKKAKKAIEKKKKEGKKQKEKSKKKDKKKKRSKSKNKPKLKIKIEAPTFTNEGPVKEIVSKFVDRSTNYITKEALVVLRSLTSIADITSFVKGEKRVTITRSVNASQKKIGLKH